MHLETEHPADTPLLGLGQQGCPFLQNILSQLTYHRGSQNCFKELTPLAVNVQEQQIRQYY